MNNDDLMTIANYIEEIESVIRQLTRRRTETIANKAYEYTDKIMDIVIKEYEKQLGPV